MRVTDVDAVPVSVPAEKRLRTGGDADADPDEREVEERTYDHLVVRVDLADGTRGYGEVAPHPDWPHAGTRDACRVVVKDRYAPVVEGTDVVHVARTAERLDREAAGLPFARAGVDVALHDALGRHLDVPLYSLLGGPTTDDRELEIHHTVGIESPESVREEASAAADRGIEAFKLKVGGPDPAAEVRRLVAVREAVPDARIRVDANGAWAADEAIRRVRALDDAADGLVFVEQPVPHDDIEGLRRVRAATPPPVMADEGCYSARDAVRLANREAVDVVNLKVANAGGLHGATRAAAVADALGLSCFAGGMLELGIGAAASAHFAVSTPAIRYPTGIFNRFAEHALIEDAADWEPSGPRVAIPDRPGLGVTVDGAALDRYRV